MGASAVGNIVASLVLKSGASKQTLFIVFAGMVVVGAFLLSLLKKPKIVNDNEEISKFTDFDDKEAKKRTSMEDIKDTFALMITPRMVYVLPLIIWSGISNAYYASVIFDLITRTLENEYDDKDGDKINEIALMAMSLIGIGGFFGGQVVGLIRDVAGVKIAISVEIGLLITATVLVDLFNQRNTFGPLAYVLCFAWGFQDSGTQTIIKCILGFQFSSKIIPFSVFNFVQSLAIFMF